MVSNLSKQFWACVTIKLWVGMDNIKYGLDGYTITNGKTATGCPYCMQSMKKMHIMCWRVVSSNWPLTCRYKMYR